MVCFPGCLEALKALAPLAVAVLVAWFASRAYFRQKEFELVRDRHLEGGVDQLGGSFEYALGCIRHNYSRFLQVVKIYRDGGLAAARELAEKNPPLRIEASKIDLASAYRVHTLTREAAFGGALGSLFALANRAENVFVNGLDVSLQAGETDRLPAEKADKLFDAALELHREAERFTTVLYRLHDLGRLLERKRLSFRELDSFAGSPEVQQIREAVRALVQ